MSYQVFARKYRPQDFDSVVGQDHITRTLKNAIEQQRLAHAYLFVGPRGVGKTSTARILAKALNCKNAPTVTPCGECDACREIAQGNSLDVLEIDGASNNGVEQVRELRENVRFAPAHGRYKIYIIDEVHMLTTAAFNALLKTLEEPPAHVIFIFATTEPQKVLATILSRCQRFDLRRIPATLIADHLQYIAKNEKIDLKPEAASAIAKGAEGGLRDAESMLDQLVAFCGDTIAEDDVLSVFGFTAQETIRELCDAILDGSCPAALEAVHSQAEAGKDLSRLMADLIGHIRNLLVLQADPKGLDGDASVTDVEALRTQSAKISIDRLLTLIDQFAEAEGRMKWAPNKKLHFEIAVIKAIQTLSQATLDEVLDALAAIRGGQAPAAPRRAPATLRPPVQAAVAQRQTSPPLKKDSVTETPAPRTAETPTPPTTPPARTTVSDPAEVWKSLLIAVRDQRPLILSWIECGTLDSLSADKCVIAFPPGQQLAMDSVCRPATRKFLEGLLREISGRTLEIKCEQRAGLVVEAPKLPEKIVEPPPDPQQAFRDDPLIKKALEIFKGEIQPS